MSGSAALVCLLVAAAATTVETATAAGSAVTLELHLDERAGSKVAVDTSGLGHHGAIGSHIRMNGAYADWDRHPPDEDEYYGADHLIVVDDASDGSLDPGSGTFTVELRYRSDHKFGNVLQKGQAKTVGGQVKLQQPKGHLSCMFKSPKDRAAVKSTKPLSDGAWHTIRCVRTPTAVTLYVDGVLDNRIRKSTSSINNKKPWTLGGKYDCDTSDPKVGADSCDYFPGDIAYLRLTKG